MAASKPIALHTDGFAIGGVRNIGFDQLIAFRCGEDAGNGHESIMFSSRIRYISCNGIGFFLKSTVYQ